MPSRASLRRARAGGLTRFYGLTALSTILPGAGLLATRRRRVGAVILGCFIALVVVLLAVAGSQGVVRTGLRLAVSRGALLAVLAVMAVATVVWCAGIIVTAMSTRPHPLATRDSVLTKAFAAAACVVVALPAGLAMRDVAVQRTLIGTIFKPSAGHRPGVGPDQSRPDPWAAMPRVNVLLLGSDAGRDRVGVRTDSMMVASIDTHTGDTVLFGVPRNLERVPIPASNPLSRVFPHGYDCGDQCLLNGIWTAAMQHQDLFPGNPNPGMSTTRDVVGAVLGLHIDYTTVIDLRGFQALVDAMGGVNINVKERVTIGGHVVDGRVVGIVGWINPGYQHLDGYHALWYARSRATTDDFNRMRRQRCVVGALVDQVNPVTMLQRYPALAKVAKDNITVDIPAEDLPAWVTLVERMQNATIRSLPLTDRNIDITHPDFTQIHNLVRTAITSKPAPAKTAPTASATPSGTPSAAAKAATPTAPAGAPASASQPPDTLTNLKDTC